MKNLEIKKGYITIIFVILIVVAFPLLAALLLPSSKLGLAGIVLGLTGIIISFLIYRQQKKLKEIVKSRKILEIKQRIYEILPKSLRYAMIFVYCLLAFVIIVNVIYGNNIGFSLIPLLICYSIIFFVERRYEIYEKGIVYGMQFIKWDEIKKVKWENGILKIKAEKVIGSIMIRDENMGIKKIIEKYVKSEQDKKK